MESSENVMNSLWDASEEYGKTTYELTKLKLLEGVTTKLTSLFSNLIAILAAWMFIIILNIGIALLLCYLLDSMHIGFFIVAAFYLILAVIIHYFLHNWIKESLYAYLVDQILIK
jgi:hypothetical protein